MNQIRLSVKNILLKEVEIKRRARVKEEALVKYERALQEGKIEEAEEVSRERNRIYEEILSKKESAGECAA